MSLLFIAVAANRRRVSTFLSSLPAASTISTAISLTLFTAIALALRRPLTMVCGLTPCSTRSRTSFRISPARTTTEVVPSPTSASWDRAMSVRMRAAGCTISNSYVKSQQPSPATLFTITNSTHLHHRSSIVGDGLPAVIVDKQQIPSIWTESALNRRLHRNAGINVRDDLTLSLRGIGPYIPHNKTRSATAHGQNSSEWMRYGPSFRTMIVGAWPAKAILMGKVFG